MHYKFERNCLMKMKSIQFFKVFVCSPFSFCGIGFYLQFVNTNFSFSKNNLSAKVASKLLIYLPYFRPFS